MATFERITHSRLRAGLALALLVSTGCASATPKPMTVHEIAVQKCHDDAYASTSGMRTATYTTTVLGLFLWPLLIVPLTTGLVAVSQERSAREECLAKLNGAPAPEAPTAATTLVPTAATTLVPTDAMEDKR
jgi:hypothetical protein